MKTIEAVAAIIKHNNKIFTIRRCYGEFENMWVASLLRSQKKPEILTNCEHNLFCYYLHCK